MEKLGELLKELRGGRSLREIGDITELSHTYISDIEKGYRRGTKKPINPSPETLKRLADAYNYPYEQLMKVAGYIDGTSYAVPEIAKQLSKDERDIAKRMKKMKKDLIEGNADGEGLNFMGEPMSEEAIESLLEALEHAERIATLANKKFAPNKYKDDK